MYHRQAGKLTTATLTISLFLRLLRINLSSLNIKCIHVDRKKEPQGLLDEEKTLHQWYRVWPNKGAYFFYMLRKLVIKISLQFFKIIIYAKTSIY